MAKGVDRSGKPAHACAKTSLKPLVKYSSQWNRKIESLFGFIGRSRSDFTSVISGLLFWSNHPRSHCKVDPGAALSPFQRPPPKKKNIILANHQHKNRLGRKPPPSQLKCLWKGAALIASHPRNGASPQALSSTLRVKMTINQKIGDIHEYPSFRQTHTLEGRLGWLCLGFFKWVLSSGSSNSGTDMQKEPAQLLAKCTNWPKNFIVTQYVCMYIYIYIIYIYIYIYILYIYTDILNVVCKLEDPKIVYVTGNATVRISPPFCTHLCQQQSVIQNVGMLKTGSPPQHPWGLLLENTWEYSRPPFVDLLTPHGRPPTIRGFDPLWGWSSERSGRIENKKLHHQIHNNYFIGKNHWYPLIIS